MSLVIDPPPAALPKRPRRTRRTARPAVALLAQGEPMVWMTGGAIGLCVAMILGLLVLVLWQGLPTFWPAPLVRIATADGQVWMGEVTRSESFTLRRDDQATQSQSEKPVTGGSTSESSAAAVVTRRRLLRTGNFELTNRHFQWIHDLEIAQAGESRPTWGLTIERQEWGRFYGEPLAFTRRLRRVADADEQELTAIREFLEANQGRLAADETDRFAEALSAVTTAQLAARASSVGKLLATMSPQSGVVAEAVLEDGRIVPLAECRDSDAILEFQETRGEPATIWQQFQTEHGAIRQRCGERERLEHHDIGQINRRIEEARQHIRAEELRSRVQVMNLADAWMEAENALRTVRDSRARTRELVARITARFSDNIPLQQLAAQLAARQEKEVTEQEPVLIQSRDQARAALHPFPASVVDTVGKWIAIRHDADHELAQVQNKVSALNDENDSYSWTLLTADGQEKRLRLQDVVRAYPANQLTWQNKLAVYFSRWWEFLSDDPREANSEGGVFPAIWGTIVMTLVMSSMVVPFGVLAALYMREYAQAGIVVSAIRVSISNLAGVPSIVFGVFGLGFFCYVCGSWVDGGPGNAGLVPFPPLHWWLFLVVLAVCGLAAFSSALIHLPRSSRAGVRRGRRWLGYISLVLWLATVGIGILLIVRSPYFTGIFAAGLPNPTFGKGGLLWASFTLALLTVPVVIVATEEAISAVPNSLREGSYACGASKWQTIRRIVLPHALPGIMTGMILAMARGAGEVAPLMLVGAVKLAPDLPIDTSFPYVHLDRSFMHLGFHIFDVGFQSQNSEAAKPMVYTTTLLLIVIIATLNLVAVWVRARLRQRTLTGHF